MSNLRPHLLSLFCCWAVLGAAQTSSAQSNSLFGSSGPLSQPRGGTAGTGSMGRSGFGGANSAGALTGAATGGLGGVAGQQGQGRNGQQGGAFIGQGTQSPFIGATQRQGTQNGMNGMNRGAGNFGTGGQGNLQNRNNQNQNQQRGNTGRQQRAPVRPRLEVAFDYRQPAPPVVNQRLTTSLQKLIHKRSVPGQVTVDLADGVVTLRGSVDKPQTGKLLEAMARLEPGVRTVRNELQIAP